MLATLNHQAFCTWLSCIDRNLQIVKEGAHLWQCRSSFLDTLRRQACQIDFNPLCRFWLCGWRRRKGVIITPIHFCCCPSWWLLKESLMSKDEGRRWVRANTRQTSIGLSTFSVYSNHSVAEFFLKWLWSRGGSLTETNSAVPSKTPSSSLVVEWSTFRDSCHLCFILELTHSLPATYLPLKKLHREPLPGRISISAEKQINCSWMRKQTNSVSISKSIQDIDHSFK